MANLEWRHVFKDIWNDLDVCDCLLSKNNIRIDKTTEYVLH